ncbi:MAG TPA: ABC transporter permease/substrate-binding protein [Kofleriaceae bacterium]|jgi:osmoprotectant transport system permease protein|nr:ABC transporter permease/substrate-binding protein [Kofleriaceae bacterium]
MRGSTGGLGDLLAGLPPLVASHLALVLVALGIAVALGLPLAVALARRPRAAAPVLTIAGAIQTVPGLALLALMVPVLAATHGLGLGVSSFGFAPAAIALTLYALLPILRNAITGLAGVDAATVEAARGMGMAPSQVLRMVELPLAAPVIAAGIRTASVWTVGAATLATPIGQPCLGNYIFAGLQTRNYLMLLVGVGAAATLALILDAILAATEQSVSRRPRGKLVVPGAVFAALVIVILGVLPRLPGSEIEPTASGSPAAATADHPLVTKVRVGAKTFTEQYILAELLRARLAKAGVSAEVVESLGSNVVFEALRHGDLDTYVDYSGTLWTNQLGRERGAPRWQILAEVEGYLARQQVRSLGPLGFQNAYALAVRRDTATRLGLHGVGDLAPHASTLALGADYEFLSRREWAAVRTAYGLAFRRTASFDPALLYEAVARGEVDVISAFSSDGRIAAYDLVVLDDPAAALPSYDAMILLGPQIAGDPRVVCALAPLRGALPVELVRRANLQVDHDHTSPRDAARWLLDQASITETCP